MTVVAEPIRQELTAAPVEYTDRAIAGRSLASTFPPRRYAPH